MPHGSIWRDWSFELKRRARLPVMVTKALDQAAADVAIGGDWRKPAVVMREDNGRSIFIAYLDDIEAWAGGLAEIGNSSKVREAIRVLERDIETLKGTLR